MALRLRKIVLEDEAAFLQASEAMKPDDFEFAFYYEQGMDFGKYLDMLDAATRGQGVPAQHVASTFLVGDVDGEIIGRVSVRHELTEFLRKVGGHIGYGVLPMQRGKGHATEMLRQALDVARDRGLPRVLVTCDESNLASRKVIERCGGALDSVYTGPEVSEPKLRFWIDLGLRAPRTGPGCVQG
jgi:predicted acetyltransferase